jgi:hypothetical protein
MIFQCTYFVFLHYHGSNETQIIPVSGDDEVAVHILAAFILHAHPCLAPGLVNVIRLFGDVTITLARMFWNIPMSYNLGKNESRKRETEKYGHECRGTRNQE